MEIATPPKEEPPPQTLAPSERRTNGHVQPGDFGLGLRA